MQQPDAIQIDYLILISDDGSVLIFPLTSPIFASIGTVVLHC